MVRIRFTKDTKLCKKGQVVETSDEEAKLIINEGYAEYLKGTFKAAINASKKKPTKKSKSTKDVNVKENVATPLLPTTRYYIKSWGYYNKNKKIIIEQINPSNYIYNNDGDLGIVEASEQYDLIGDKIKRIGYGFQIDGELYLIKNRNILPLFQFCNVPSLSKCEQFIAGKIKPRTYLELHGDVKKSLKALFDFSNETDVEVSAIAVGQSWLKPELNNAFFYGIDASKGGGKTTLGEIVYFLMRHGNIGGNISTAAAVRLIDELDLNIFVDELDQNLKDDDIMATFRKGQRRGNPYIRCEGRDQHPTLYDIFGCHGFSFRSELEDAFMDRTLRVHTTKSKDAMLPIINTYKREILKSLADELFFWYISNILVVGCSEEKRCSRVFNANNIDRNGIFNTLTSNLSPKEKEFLSKVFGRDNELSYLCIEVGKMLGVDLLTSLAEIIQHKKNDEASSEGFYLEELREFIASISTDIVSRKLQDGEHAGSPFFPKNLLYSKYVQHLKEINIQSIGSKRFSSLIRDLGFTEGINLKSQRYGNFPSPCLIFDADRYAKLIAPAILPKQLKEIEVEFVK